MKYGNLNILKVISIVFIFVGHCCLQFNNEHIARFCGYLFVQIFFLVSAFVLGIKYGFRPIDKYFLLNRWKRLSSVYYPFLIVSMSLLLCFCKSVGYKEVITHFTYTNYIFQCQICGVSFGHLWYISMQMICYVMVALLCMPALYGLVNKMVESPSKISCVFLIVLLVGYVFTLFNIPCRIPIILASYLVIFVRAKDILNWFDNLRLDKSANVYAWIIAVVFNVIIFFLFFFWNLNEKLLLRDSLVLFTAFSWLILFMVPLRNIKAGKVICFISSISFEIYLIHNPFISGSFSWLNERNGTGNIYLNVICLPILIVILAWLLNRIGKSVSSLFAIKKEISEK